MYVSSFFPPFLPQTDPLRQGFNIIIDSMNKKKNNIEKIEKKRRAFPTRGHEAQIVELHDNNHTTHTIAKMFDCSHQAVSGAIKRHAGRLQRVENFKKNRADLFAEKQHELLSGLDRAAVKKMAPAAAVVALGILFDKERLERGQSTEIIDTKSLIINAEVKLQTSISTLTEVLKKNKHLFDRQNIDTHDEQEVIDVSSSETEG